MSQPEKTAPIVDDEESMRYVLSNQLSQLGYQCVAVSSGRDALDKVAIQEFDLMMLDVKMPGMSELEVLGKFRPRPSTSFSAPMPITRRPSGTYAEHPSTGRQYGDLQSPSAKFIEAKVG